LDRLLEEYRGRVKLVYYYVAPHESSFRAAEAVLCAGEQGKYWEYHRKLFDQQINLLLASDPVPYFKEFAGQLGLNGEEFNSCLNSHRMAEVVNRAEELRKSLGVRYTPTIFIGDKKIEGLQEIEVYRDIIEEQLGKQ
jgi:protein-disulfide isomerase